MRYKSRIQKGVLGFKFWALGLYVNSGFLHLK